WARVGLQCAGERAPPPAARGGGRAPPPGPPRVGGGGAGWVVFFLICARRSRARRYDIPRYRAAAEIDPWTRIASRSAILPGPMLSQSVRSKRMDKPMSAIAGHAFAGRHNDYHKGIKMPERRAGFGVGRLRLCRAGLHALGRIGGVN